MANLTQEDIDSACEEIWIQGIEPSNGKVRKILGRGSFSTIQKGVKTWKKVNKDRISNASNRVEPMPETIQTLATKLWTHAVVEAENRDYSTYFHILETANEELREELVKYEMLQAEFNVMKETQKDLLNRVSKLSQEKGQLESRVKELETRELAK